MKTTKIFKHGNSQAVRIPKEFRLPEGEVFIKKQGDTILLIPKQQERWSNVKHCLGQFKGDFDRQQPTDYDQRAWPE